MYRNQVAVTFWINFINFNHLTNYYCGYSDNTAKKHLLLLKYQTMSKDAKLYIIESKLISFLIIKVQCGVHKKRFSCFVRKQKNEKQLSCDKSVNVHLSILMYLMFENFICEF